MSKVKKLLKRLENLIEERDADSKTEISGLIQGMSLEEKEAVGFQIILDMIHWMESLDWETIDKKKVRKREVWEVSSYTEKNNPGREYLATFGLRFNIKNHWSVFGRLSGGLVDATENKTVPTESQETMNHRTCLRLKDILGQNDTAIFTWSNALMEGFVAERDTLFIEAGVKDAIWFILDHVKDFKALWL